MEKRLFGKMPTGEEIYTYTMTSENASLTVMNYGAVIVSFVPFGKDIICGHETLEEYLDTRVFKNIDAITIQPDTGDISGFDKYAENYIKLLHVEKSAIENI